MKTSGSFLSVQSLFMFTTLVPIIILCCIPVGGYCGGFLYSANPDDRTVTRISLETGVSEVIMNSSDGLTRPSELTVDAFGNLYVANVESRDVLRLRTDGSVEIFVSGAGTLHNIHGLDFSQDGELFILDSSNAGGQVYRLNGDSGALEPFSGNILVMFPSFYSAEDIEFDSEGNLFVASGVNAQGRGAVVKIAPDGNAVVFASQLQNPRSLAVDCLGYLYVASRVGEIVDRFTLATGAKTVFANLSSCAGDPRGVVTDANNNVYVLNSNGDIRVWNSAGSGGGVVYHSGSGFSEALEFFAGQQIEPEQVLISLEIVGPNEMPDNNTAQFDAIAHYSDGSMKNVTSAAEWSVDSNQIAQINIYGILTTFGLTVSEEEITVYARYSEGEVSVSAQQSVIVYTGCTDIELFERNIKGALKLKKEIMEELKQAIELETRAKCLLNEFARDPNFTEWNRHEIMRARFNLQMAIYKEIICGVHIRGSIGFLEQAEKLCDDEPPVPGR